MREDRLNRPTARLRQPIARRIVRLPAAVRVARRTSSRSRPPRNFLDIGIAGDNPIAASDLCDRHNLTINLYLLPRAPDTIFLVTVRYGLVVETRALNGSHLAERAVGSPARAHASSIRSVTGPIDCESTSKTTSTLPSRISWQWTDSWLPRSSARSVMYAARSRMASVCLDSVSMMKTCRSRSLISSLRDSQASIA